MSVIRILPYAIPALAAGVLAAALRLARRDGARKRGAPGEPELSVVVPAYNCEDSIAEAVERLFQAYDPGKIDLIIVDDASTDGTAGAVDRLRERYPFEVLTKTRNEGKARALNDGIRKSRRDLVLVLDADTSVRRPVLDDLLRRLGDPRVGAASARYVAANRGFLPRMTGISYALLAIGQAAQNPRACLSLWGGCMLFKRTALEAIGGFRPWMLLEDMDAALRLARAGWRAEQAWTPVRTRIPERPADWLRQQVRWASGMMQCLLTHPGRQVRNPVLILLAILFWLVSAGMVVALLLPGTYGLPTAGFLAAAFMLLSLPFALAASPGAKWKAVLLVVPYTFVCFPLHATVAGFSFLLGIYRYFRLRRGGRAW